MGNLLKGLGAFAILLTTIAVIVWAFSIHWVFGLLVLILALGG